MESNLPKKPEAMKLRVAQEGAPKYLWVLDLFLVVLLLIGFFCAVE